MLLLFIGEKQTSASPSSKLARNLEPLGCSYVFSTTLPRQSWRQRLALLSRVDAVVVQAYGAPGSWIMRQCSISVAMGNAVVRHWAGSDVLRCLEDADVRREALVFDKLGVLNITPAPWLSEELESIGVRAEVYSQMIESVPDNAVPDAEPLPLAVLVYLPSSKRESYGLEIVRAAIERNRDIQFVIVADTDHSLAEHPNVESLGWVSDMDDLWPRIGCVLRITPHDGWPRMVLEGLARGKYAICSLPMEGCWHATETNRVDEHLDRFRKERVSLNAEGVQAAHRMREGRGAEKILELMEAHRRTTNLRRRLKGFLIAVSLTMRSRKP